MTITITKLPPGYPEGSGAGMAPWLTNSAGLRRYRGDDNGQRRKYSLDGVNYPGCDLHLQILDLGLSAAEFDNWDATVAVEPQEA